MSRGCGLIGTAYHITWQIMSWICKYQSLKLVQTKHVSAIFSFGSIPKRAYGFKVAHILVWDLMAHQAHRTPGWHLTRCLCVLGNDNCNTCNTCNTPGKYWATFNFARSLWNQSFGGLVMSDTLTVLHARHAWYPVVLLHWMTPKHIKTLNLLDHEWTSVNTSEHLNIQSHLSHVPASPCECLMSLELKLPRSRNFPMLYKRDSTWPICQDKIPTLLPSRAQTLAHAELFEAALRHVLVCCHCTMRTQQLHKIEVLSVWVFWIGEPALARSWVYWWTSTSRI